MDQADRRDWSAVRAAYEAGADTLVDICTRHGVSASAVRRRRLKEGWRPRRSGSKAGPAATPKAKAEASHGRRRRCLVARLFDALERQMRDIKLRLDTGDPTAGASAAARERDARTLASLARTLEKLIEIDAGASRSEGEGTAHRDIEALRIALAQRIQRLAGGGPDG